ncbi:hypothetical protein NU688_30755 [Variovorax sp. ZS18.2.2]|uniref:hypothetical protein n=1 Tax=Variovorax sp. ZS18.2.2 TaxID=2971255 RepID=UPI0021516BC6|nr:hypothetical protein [Variovorax sp. ZS18.2.2]MCR6480569.1 hypothetical protein [Variovorax sp. ZS18.2.2]
MDFFNNVRLSLTAAGPAAVICVLTICITLLGLFGSGPLANGAMSILAIGFGGTVFSLGTRN